MDNFGFFHDGYLLRTGAPIAFDVVLLGIVFFAVYLAALEKVFPTSPMQDLDPRFAWASVVNSTGALGSLGYAVYLLEANTGGWLAFGRFILTHETQRHELWTWTCWAVLGLLGFCFVMELWTLLRNIGEPVQARRLPVGARIGALLFAAWCIYRGWFFPYDGGELILALNIALGLLYWNWIAAGVAAILLPFFKNSGGGAAQTSLHAAMRSRAVFAGRRDQ